MKHFRPVLATLIIALSAMGLVESVASNTESESASSDRLVRGILITLDDVDRPECSTSLQGFVYDDGEETTACMDNQWQSVVIDADGDGHVRGTDEDDNDATDKGDSDLIANNIRGGIDIFGVSGNLTERGSFAIAATTPSASAQTASVRVPAGVYDGDESVSHVVKGDSDLVPANIKSGVDIFDIEGTLVVSSVVDNDADGITRTLDEDDNDATDKGDSDLIANNIRGGIDIFGVSGNLTERGSFAIAATTPSASAQTASVRVPAGVYDGDESVSHVVKGDSDLVPANIKSGVDIFDIEGTLVVSSVVDNDADGITSTLDEDDNDATDKGDSDLVAANIKKGVSIFGVTGTYPTPSSETYDTVSAGYNHHTGYGLRVGTLAGHAYCKGKGKDEMSSYITMISQGGVGLFLDNNRLTVTEGRGGGYRTFRIITCSDFNL